MRATVARGFVMPCLGGETARRWKQIIWRCLIDHWWDFVVEFAVVACGKLVWLLRTGASHDSRDNHLACMYSRSEHSILG